MADQVHRLWDIAVPFPELATGLRVEGEDVVVASGDVHDAVDYDWIGFEAVLRAQTRMQPRHPHASELGDVGRVDLIERRIALVVERATVRDPVFAAVLRLRQLLGADRPRPALGSETGGEEHHR